MIEPLIHERLRRRCTTMLFNVFYVKAVVRITQQGWNMRDRVVMRSKFRTWERFR